MELRPFFRYAGSKWRTAKKYPAPRFGAIVEPFAGAAGYSLRYADRAVTLVDSDERICGAWDFLIHASVEDIKALPILRPGERVDDFPIDDARKWVIGYNINVAARPSKTATRWDHLWNEARRDIFAQQVQFIRHWKVLHASYSEAPKLQATYFVDPPYQTKQIYRDKFTEYENLAKWVKSLPGEVMVCEGPGATWLPFTELFSATSHCNATQSHGPVAELIWYAQNSRPAL